MHTNSCPERQGICQIGFWHYVFHNNIFVDDNIIKAGWWLVSVCHT